MKKIIKLTLSVCLGLAPMGNQLFAQTNTSFGNSAGTGGTGNNNSFYGYTSGQSNSTGSDNTFLGASAGKSNSSGSNNTFLGSSAGISNSNGTKNVFVGWYAGNANTYGYNNLFIGSKAGKSNTSGFRNTYLGPGVGLFNVSGYQNTAVGYLAGRNNQNGLNNVSLGSYAGYSNLGSYNVFIGHKAGYFETGNDKLYIDNSNTQTPLIYGDFASDKLEVNGEMKVTGNVDVGHFSSSSVNLKSTGGVPMSLSEELTSSCSTSKWHFTVGRVCGVGPIPPPFRVMTFNYLGAGAYVGIGEDTPQYQLDVNGVVRTTQLLTFSDKRLKEEVKPIKNAGELLSQLEGVTYNYRKDLKDEGRNLAEGKQIGFIAQDVQKVIPEIVKEDGEGYLSVSYQSLIPLLVENQKELQTQNDLLKEQLEETQETNRRLESEMESIKALLSSLSEDIPTKTVELDNSREEMLLQNAPNPFSEMTSIEYNLPTYCSETQLLILDVNGKIVKSIENLEVGRGKVVLQANSLTPGTYRYTLVCQGQTLATKSMVIVR